MTAANGWSGKAAVTWPPGSVPVSVLRGRPLRPDITLAPGDRVNLLTEAPLRDPADNGHVQHARGGNGTHA